MTINASYLTIIGEKYPAVSAFDNTYAGNVYETLQLSEGSDPLPSKAVLDADILAANKTCMWKLIQAERDRRRQTGGVLHPGVNKWFHSDDTSRIQFLGMMLYGANLPAGIMWKTMDGSFIEMTQALVGQVFALVAQGDTANFTKAEHHKGTMLASSTPETYDYLTNPSIVWPSTYAESIA